MYENVRINARTKMYEYVRIYTYAHAREKPFKRFLQSIWANIGWLNKNKNLKE